MKVDGLAVILAIILLPIILVVTYYIHLQVDTIATENQYNTKLLNATYDAMSAFEINTANEDLSSVADSMRSIILASNNIFFNTLATNFGLSNSSKELIQPYIPAILYTLYDGYYIYAPTEVPIVAEDISPADPTDPTSELEVSNGALTYDPSDTSISVETDSTTVKGDILYEADTSLSGGKPYTAIKEHAVIAREPNYMLKSYVQYSARYVQSNIDVTVNYTLDNYINVSGTIGDVYYTKSGYLIDTGLITDASIGGISFAEVKNLNEYDAKNRIVGLKTANMVATGVNAADISKVTINGQEIVGNFAYIKSILEPKYGVEINTMDDAEVYFEKMKEEVGFVANADINNIEYEMQKCEAVTYYISSYLFSNWVNTNLGTLRVRKYTTN